MRVNVAEAVEKLTGIITDADDLNFCLTIIGNALGSRRLEENYADKISRLVESYRSINEADLRIISLVETLEPTEISNAEEAIGS